MFVSHIYKLAAIVKKQNPNKNKFMKSSKLILLFTLIVLSFHFSHAQEKVKLKFKKIELAYYDAKENSSEIKVSNYAQINEYGIVTVHLNGNRGLKFYRYQLSDKLMREINSLLNGKNFLKNNLVKTQMKTGRRYAGSYNFIAFDKEILCFVEPYMSMKFNSVFSQLEDVILKQSENSETENPKFNIKQIEKRVLNEHTKSNYLPKIEQPSRMK